MPDNASGAHGPAPLSPAAHELAQRLGRRRETLAQAIVEQVQREVPDYSHLGALTMTGDVMETALLTIDDLLASLVGGDQVGASNAEVIRRSASRRVHQDVSLPSLLHSYRIWGSQVWQAVLDEAGSDEALRGGALEIATRIFAYVDLVSITLARVYVEESAGANRARDVLRSDVLESLLLGRALSEGARVEMARLRLASDSRIATLLVRMTDVPVERLRSESIAALRACRTHLSGETAVLLGVRESDVICLARVSNEFEHDRLIAGAHAVAGEAPTWRVCLGRPHHGLEGIPRSFEEAQETSAIAALRGVSGRALLYSDIILDRILLHSAHAQDLVDEYVRPLLDYDRQHSSELVATLRAFISNDFNMTRTAKNLHVNPNTVAYRIKRIGHVTDVDATTSDGALILALALRLLNDQT